MRFICDDMRHLICIPYTIENLHLMAKEFGIKKCWFHSSSKYKHYDIPKRRIDEIKSKCEVVNSRTILLIMKGKYVG